MGKNSKSLAAPTVAKAMVDKNGDGLKGRFENQDG
jgi:hypothetical protein